MTIRRQLALFRRRFQLWLGRLHVNDFQRLLIDRFRSRLVCVRTSTYAILCQGIGRGMITRNVGIIRPRNRAILFTTCIPMSDQEDPCPANGPMCILYKRQRHQIVMDYNLCDICFLIHRHLLRPNNMGRYMLHSMTFHRSNRGNGRLTIFISHLFKFRPSDVISELISNGLVHKGVRRTRQLNDYCRHYRLFVRHRLLRFLVHNLYHRQAGHRCLNRRARSFGSYVRSVFLFVALSFVMCTSTVLLFPFLPTVCRVRGYTMLRFNLIFLRHLQ